MCMSRTRVAFIGGAGFCMLVSWGKYLDSSFHCFRAPRGRKGVACCFDDIPLIHRVAFRPNRYQSIQNTTEATLLFEGKELRSGYAE